jgi:hypothetical protein
VLVRMAVLVVDYISAEAKFRFALI